MSRPAARGKRRLSSLGGASIAPGRADAVTGRGRAAIDRPVLRFSANGRARGVRNAETTTASIPKRNLPAFLPGTIQPAGQVESPVEASHAEHGRDRILRKFHLRPASVTDRFETLDSPGRYYYHRL